MKMDLSKTKLIIPCSLKTLLEGVSRAVIKHKPEDITEFIALYFQELIAFRKENPNLDITEVVEKFDFEHENWKEELEEKTLDHTETLLSNEPQKREVCTDTEEDQLLEDVDTEYSSKITQYPSTVSSIAENKSPTGLVGASSPEGPELAYVPADPAQLAAHVLGNSDSVYSVRDVATSVQTLREDSQTSEHSFAPVEGAVEDAASAAEAYIEAVRSQSAVQNWSSIAGELGPSDSQADVSTNDVNQVSSIPLQEEPSPLLPPSLLSKQQLQAVRSCSTTEAVSATEGTSLCCDDEMIMDAQVSPYTEQFPEKIIIPFIERTAYVLKAEQPLNASQVSCAKTLGPCAKTLGPSAADAACQPERMESTAHVESAEQVYAMSAMASSEAGQPPPYSNVWTLYCLTDLRQGQKSPSHVQLPQVSAPIYVMQEENKRGNAPPFILVGSTVQNVQNWKSIPSHAVFAQRDAGARRLTVVPVPVARPADEKTDMASPNSGSAEETAAGPHVPDFISVAIPLDDVIPAKKRLTSW